MFLIFCHCCVKPLNLAARHADRRRVMGTIEALSLAMGTAWTSGINLYATVATLGIAGRLDMIRLPAKS